MAKILNTKEEVRKKHERTQIKQFNDYNDILDYLYGLKTKPKRTSIWRYFDKWCISINYEKD